MNALRLVSALLPFFLFLVPVSSTYRRSLKVANQPVWAGAVEGSCTKGCSGAGLVVVGTPGHHLCRVGIAGVYYAGTKPTDMNACLFWDQAKEKTNAIADYQCGCWKDTSLTWEDQDTCKQGMVDYAVGHSICNAPFSANDVHVGRTCGSNANGALCCVPDVGVVNVNKYLCLN